MSNDYKSPILAADGILLKNNGILLVRRNISPFKGFWTLPGGHVEYGEKVEEAILREFKEETNLQVKIKDLIGIYSDPERDPRYHSVSIAYWLESAEGKITLNDESSEFKLFDLEDVPDKLGFDHGQIIEDFKKHYENKDLH